MYEFIFATAIIIKKHHFIPEMNKKIKPATINQ